MTHAETRSEMAQELLAQSKSILAEGPPDPTRLNRIKGALSKLSERAELWSETDFPNPSLEEKQNRFQIAQDAESGLTLYLNVMRPGKKIPPHNHTTWACVAAVEGVETNRLYERLDDRSVPGKAELRETAVVELKPGNALGMGPDDIHSVVIGGDSVIRHLHFYGQPLETLSGRISYDLDAGTCRIMDIGVKTKS
ncbi:cysteine dioxygenase family protein [Denitrobaculum tricleocarpae]|uniref:Cysteine dioxygenase n=1 Tax=Denitrobaculum tricleocarpae TaxID=2591009 RepID=A0A545TX45_9PROT|nr:cysteine dioxygenase family protein [Denitrobaculum tricleocarpae]TQV81795.1 hypothetical protein FKG95_06020 [Denitrobaculum tricleocarpae]